MSSKTPNTPKKEHISRISQPPKMRKSPQNKAFYGLRDTYSGKAHCIKDRVLLDPACGTAGFLVSAAEHIRRNYEDTMTDEQWANFESKTFSGYDTERPDNA